MADATDESQEDKRSAGKVGRPKSRNLDGRIKPFPRERFLKFCAQLKIQSKDFGLVSFVPLGSQVYMLDEIEKGLAEGVSTFVILKARQLGASTFFLALDLFWAFEYDGILGVFATHEEASRDQFRAQITLYLQTLPKGFRVGAETNNRLMLILQNNSLFRYLVAGQRTTTNKLGRSGGTNYCHATEVAFWGSFDDLKALMQTFSHLYPHRAYFFESTANGFNHFEEMWQTALTEPSQRAIFVGWWRDERNEFSETHPYYKFYMPDGTRSPLEKREQEGIKAVKDEYGFRITAGQIAWYRWKLATECGGDQDTMDQENPWTAEDAFVATGSKFMVNEALTKQLKAAKKLPCMPFTIVPVQRWQDIQIVATKSVTQCQLKIWEEPKPWGKYAIGCDVAFGSSPDNDRTVISVWRVWADCAEQVAEYCTPDHSTYQCACVLAYLGGLYRDCIVNIEVNGPGKEVLADWDRLKIETKEMVGPEGPDLRNVFSRMREFLFRRVDSIGGGFVRHFVTSPGTKPQLMNRFKNYVELQHAQIRSMQCLDECRRLRIDGGTIEADTGHDDRAVAAALAVFAWSEYRMRELKAKGWTKEYSQTVEKQGGEDAIDGLLRKFFAQKRIVTKDSVDVDVREA